MVCMAVLVMGLVAGSVFAVRLFLPVDSDDEVRCRDAAAQSPFAAEGDARQPERVQLRDGGVRVGGEFQQRGGYHVAGGAHRAVEV